MPNKRASNKKGFGIYLDAGLLQEIEGYCKKHGINRVEFLKQAAEARLEEENKQQKRKKQ